MSRAYWSQAAGRDLDEIYEYLSIRNAAAADRLIDEFDRKADLYAGNPLLGEVHPQIAPDARAFRVGKYAVVYTPYRDGISISRVVHSARDLPRLFEGDF